MHKFLVADYIIGYALGAEDAFTSTEIATELLTSEAVIESVVQVIVTVKPLWFTVTTSDKREVHYTRNKQYDADMVTTLKMATTKEWFGEAVIDFNAVKKQKPKLVGLVKFVASMVRKMKEV